MTTMQIPTEPVRISIVLSAAVSGFVVGLGSAFVTMVAVPALSVPVFLAGWLITSLAALRTAQTRADAGYWGEDFGGIRDVRKWI